MGHTNGVNEADAIAQRARAGSRTLPFLTDILGNSLNDRLLFAVPKSTLHMRWLAVDSG
jgi:ATP phosphoribosyltransferase